MYAIIETGGKQYKVAVGDKLTVEKLAAEAGASVAFAGEFGRVLMVADGEAIKVGSPASDIKVSATVLGHGKDGKIRVFKMKRRKHYRRTQGHRQPFTEIQITAIGDNAGDGGGKSKAVVSKSGKSKSVTTSAKTKDNKPATVTKADGNKSVTSKTKTGDDKPVASAADTGDKKPVATATKTDGDNADDKPKVSATETAGNIGDNDGDKPVTSATETIGNHTDGTVTA